MTCTKTMDVARQHDANTKHTATYFCWMRLAFVLSTAARKSARSETPTAETRSAIPSTISNTKSAPKTHTCSIQKSPVTRPDSRSTSPMESDAVHATPAMRCARRARKVMNFMSPVNRLRSSCLSRKYREYGVSLPSRQSMTP